MAEDRSWVSPYNYVQNNPIMRIDPNGAVDTKFEDEDGNELHETQDNVDATIVVANDKVEEFNKEVEGMKGNVLVNTQKEKQTTVSLAGKYMKEGQAVTYTQDGQGNIRNLDVVSAPQYKVHQVGVRMITGVGGGATLAGGVTWDSQGNFGLYGAAGGGVVGDCSFGIEYTGNTSFSSSFNITDLNGTSVDTGGGALLFDFSTGGNTSRATLDGSGSGSMYKSSSVGLSVSPFLGGGSRTFETMKVVPIRFNK